MEVIISLVLEENSEDDLNSLADFSSFLNKILFLLSLEVMAADVGIATGIDDVGVAKGVEVVEADEEVEDEAAAAIEAGGNEVKRGDLTFELSQAVTSGFGEVSA